MDLNEYLRFLLRSRGHTEENIELLVKLAQKHLELYVQILEHIAIEINRAKAKK